MRMTFISLSLIFSSLILSACAGKGGAYPDWVNGTPENFPANKYLIGKGQDKVQAIARDRARADLAKVFEVSISEASYDQITYTSKSDGKSKLVQMDSDTSREINTHTNQIISGIQISETWKDPKTAQFHVLATLNRMKTASGLRQQINQLDDATQQAIQNAKANKDPLRKAGHANKALQLQLQRAAYQKHLKVLDLSGLGIRSPYNIALLANDHDTLLQRIQIQSRIDASPINGLDDIVAGALSNVGFSHVTHAKPDYILSTKLSLDPYQDNQGWYWQRGSLEVNLIDPSNNRSRGNKRWSIKVSSQNKALSEKRVRDNISTILNKQLRKALIQFASAN